MVVGFLGTFLVNLFRMASVAMISYFFGQLPAVIYHDYGSTIIESLSSVDLGKLQAQVDTGGEEITSERWLRVLAEMQPVFKEAVDRAVAEALKAAKT